MFVLKIDVQQLNILFLCKLKYVLDARFKQIKAAKTVD